MMPSRGSESPTHPDAPRAGGETPETRVDNLLRDFQNACEMVVVLGDSNLSETTKLRAVLRNALRASLLERHRDGERDAVRTVEDVTAEDEAEFDAAASAYFNNPSDATLARYRRVEARVLGCDYRCIRLHNHDGPHLFPARPSGSAPPSPERASK